MKIDKAAGDFIECITTSINGTSVIFVPNVLLLQKPETNEAIEIQMQYILSKPYIKDLPKPKRLPAHKRSPEASKKFLAGRAEWERNKRKTDPLFKLKKSLRGLIRSSFNGKGYRKNTKSENILGCTFQEFKEHIEKQFEPWMNWSNHGVYNSEKNTTWQIDHIIPLETAITQEDIIKLNHYTNLRPLCSKENSERRYQINRESL